MKTEIETGRIPILVMEQEGQRQSPMCLGRKGMIANGWGRLASSAQLLIYV